MSGFYALHNEACSSAIDQDFEKALLLASESLRLHPINLCLISELITIFSNTRAGLNHLIKIDRLIVQALDIAGERHSVYHLANYASFLRAKILISF